ncbi:hypothetical protein CRENBAI_021637 [Crenichthys baileyi]|uniref:TIR domain-containing protein n=1 Tax=Crenichthys baileyi TaxID=28760 RepID=A0AAV9RWK8_9TELE
MSFFRKVAWHSLRDRLRSSAIREGLGVELLLLHIERSQLRWLEQLYLDAFLGRCSRHVPPGGGPGDGQGHVGGTMSLGWPGNALGSPLRSWRRCLGRGTSGCLCLVCCPRDPVPDKRKMTSWKQAHADTKEKKTDFEVRKFAYQLASLKFLDVSINKLQSARLGSQPQLPSLLEPGCFQPLSALRLLSLDGSRKSSTLIPDLCSELSRTAIGFLSLRDIGLKTLTNRTFLGLNKTNLTVLDLSGNSISKIEDGSFQWLSGLQTLNMTGNNIKHLTRGTFNGLKMLKNLQLTKALVKSQKSSRPVIDDFSFQPLSNLESLKLQNTAFANITENTFKGLMSLTELDLSWNSYLHTERKLTNKTFVSLADSPLRKLNLEGNALVGIESGSFSCLKNLSILLLDHNFISQIFTGKEFEGLAQLKELHISNNVQAIDLTPESFVNVINLSVLTLGKSLKAETLNHDSSPFRPLSNLTVLDLSNNNIANIRENMLEGLENLRVLKLQHNNLVRLWKMANPGFSDAKVEEGRGFEYDAYVIHAEEDARWVERRMFPLEKKTCRFCLEDRDSIIGMSQFESIVNNMRKSRKILFVVTENLLKDPWCGRFKIHHALHQVIEASRDSVVLIFLQDVHDYKLSQSLFLRRGMLRERCILNWPPQKERIPAFYQKLLIALGMTNQLQE